MAIYSAVPPPAEMGGAPSNATQPASQPQQAAAITTAAVTATTTATNTSSTSAIDIEAWTISALQSLSVSPEARGTGTPLTIPLDEHAAPKAAVSFKQSRTGAEPIVPPRRPPSRRDSMKRREALLQGKEGSRQRRRWENDRLMHVPNAQPPEPSDWEPRPVYPVHHVPYQIAAVWDLRMRADVEAKKAAAARRKQLHTQQLGDKQVMGRVPRELCQRAKKIPAVKTWVRELEEPVRRFLVDRNSAIQDDSSESDGTTEDEEIVFVGRKGASMRDGWKKARRQNDTEQEEGMVFDALGDEDDESSAFKRWITHSISDYYGLVSRSVFVGTPSRKAVYVGIKQIKGRTVEVQSELPRPLWSLC